MVTVLVTGGRNYNDKQKLYSVLDQIHDVGGPPYYMEITEIVCASNTPLDEMACEWASERKKHNGTSIRYRQHVDQQTALDVSKPDIVLAFTQPTDVNIHNMISKAQQANVPVVQID